MRNFIFILLMAMAIGIDARVVELVNSIDEKKSVSCPTNDEEVVDTISCDTIDIIKPPIPQIPFAELDSMTMSSLDDLYVVVYKDGKCGIYDLRKEENVTRIEYSYLRFSFRKEMEGEFYTYFSWEEETISGLIGIAEATNQFVSIATPKKEKEDFDP